MGSPVLIYDGSCGFCTRCAGWIEGRWPSGAARAIPFQALTAEEFAEFGLSRQQTEDQAWWIDGSGTHGGELAVARALRTAGGWWSVVGATIEAPPLRWIAGPVYRWVAAHRHLMPQPRSTSSRPS